LLMSDMPPQIVRQDVTRIGASGERRPGDDLPVLNAFQRFLDMERARTRRRMVGFAACLAAALVGILAAGGAAMVFLWARAKHSLVEWEARAGEVVGRAEQRSVQLEAAVNKALEETRKWTIAFDEKRREEDRSSIDKMKAEIAALRSALDEATRAGEMFRSEIAGIRAEMPKLSNMVARLSERREGGKTRVDPASPVPVSKAGAHDAGAQEPPRAYMRFAPNDLIIAVTPTNGNRTVAWCLPIPE